MTPAKQLIFVTPGAFPIPSERSGSVERVVAQITPHLAASEHVTVIGRSTPASARTTVHQGVTFVRHPSKPVASYIANAKQSIASRKPAIVQIENRPRWLSSFHTHAERHGYRLALQLHSNTFIRRSVITPAKLRHELNLADRIVVNSHYLRRDVERRAPGVAGRIRVVHPGVDVTRFPSRFSAQGADIRAAVRKQHGWHDRLVVLFLGRLIPLKGAHHAIAMLSRVIPEHRNVLLIVVGSAFYGSHRQTSYVRGLHTQAASLQRHVEFIPYVPHHRVPRLMLAADVMLMPSGPREAFGLVNVEAMATGLAVVATRHGGMPEVIAHRRTGILVGGQGVASNQLVRELARETNALLADPATMQAYGRAGRKRVEEQFTWESAAAQWRKQVLDVR